MVFQAVVTCDPMEGVELFWRTHLPFIHQYVDRVSPKVIVECICCRFGDLSDCGFVSGQLSDEVDLIMSDVLSLVDQANDDYAPGGQFAECMWHETSHLYAPELATHLACAVSVVHQALRALVQQYQAQSVRFVKALSASVIVVELSDCPETLTC